MTDRNGLINQPIQVESLLSHSNLSFSRSQVLLQQQQQPSSGGKSVQKKAFKFQILIEQSICLDNLMNLLRDIAMAFYSLKQFECEKALGYFELLPQAQIQSSFVLSHMARAHFELHNYLKAEKLYTQLRREFPYHLEGTCIIPTHVMSPNVKSLFFSKMLQ